MFNQNWLLRFFYFLTGVLIFSLAFFQTSRKFAFRYSAIFLITILAANWINGATSLIRYGFKVRYGFKATLMSQLLKTHLIGSVAPLMYGHIQKPLTASGAFSDDRWGDRLGLLTWVTNRFWVTIRHQWRGYMFHFFGSLIARGWNGLGTITQRLCNSPLLSNRVVRVKCQIIISPCGRVYGKLWWLVWKKRETAGCIAFLDTETTRNPDETIITVAETKSS